MKIKKILVALLLVFTAFALVGCVSQEDLDAKTEELKLAQEGLAALEVVKTELQTTISGLEEELALLDEQRLELAGLLANAIADKGDLASQLAESEDEVAAKEAAIEAKDLEIAGLQADVAAKEADVAAKEAELETANTTIVLLNAQKVELEKRPKRATAVELYIGSLVSVGATTAIPDPEFDFEFTPADAYKGLYFESDNLEIVTVNQLGQITGVRPGKANITATSVLNPEATSTIEVEVKEDGQNLDIVKNAVAEVLSLVKLQGLDYAASNIQFPYPTNTSVKIKFEKENGSEIVDGLYLYTTPAADAKEIITVKADYGDASYSETFSLNVVIDLENNIFKKMEQAQTFVELLIADATSLTGKVSKSIALPTSFMGVTISWSSTNKLVISAAGEYVRPLDDAEVTLTAAYKLDAAASSLSYDVVANGYDDEEKMAYIVEEGSLKAFDGLATNAKVTFPSYDDKFNAQLTYVSKDTTLFTNDGSYVNQELAVDTPVIFEVSFEYNGAVLGTKEITIIAKAATETSKAAADFLASTDADLVPTWFPYGGEAGIQITGLPTVVGETGVAIEWTGNAEDFDETLTLKTQYLRYHESIITATFTKEGIEDTVLTFTVNTGISQDKDALIVGGRFSEQTSTEPFTKYDLLNTFSYFDKMVGSTTYTGQQYWSFYSGYTYYINGAFKEDGTFEQNEELRRTQYFAMDFMVLYITEVDEDGNPTYDIANVNAGTGGNWGILFVNLTDKEAKVDLASYSGGPAGPDGVAHGAGLGAREHDITFDGYRVGWTADAEGNIVLGSGKGVIQALINSSEPKVPIPANGYGMTYKTQENVADVVGIFANPGTTLTIEYYDLHPMNDYRNRRFVTNLDSAERGMDIIDEIIVPDEGEAAIPIATHIKNAHNFMNNYRLTDLEKSTFDTARFDAIVDRYAAIVDADLLALKAEGEDPEVVEETYLQNLLAAYNAYQAYILPLQEAITEDVWLLAEYEDKLMTKYTLTYDLNGGAVYANTKADVTDLFLNDLYQHLTDSGFNDWVTIANDGTTEKTHTLPSLEEFKNPTSTHQDSFFQLMNDTWYNPAGGYDVFNGNANHFAGIWLYEYYKVNNDAFTVDETGTSKHFVRQPEYNKWMRLFWYMNEMLQAGNQTGRDVLGREGLLYDVTYLGDGVVWGKTTKWSEVVSNSTIGSYRTVGTYILHKTVPGAAFTTAFPEDYYLFDAVKSQELVDAEVYQYTAGTAVIPEPEIGREGYNFVGWALDAEGTQLATMTPQDLGLTDITLYAKWEQEIQLIPAPGAEIGSFAIESYDESVWGSGASAKTMLDANGTGGTYWYKVILKTTATAGIYEVRQVIGGVAYAFNAETDALSIHYHDDNPASDAIQAIGITVGDFVIFQGTDVTALEAGAVDFTATVYRAAE
ncbi:MAG: InlB B-repeat-containing protein [Bacilli bacterium]|nr:InlB B-repeat-containing protein [Bacilli bacterium]